MKLDREDKEALAFAALATITTAACVTLAVQQKRVLPAALALAAAGGAIGAACYLDGVRRTELAKACDAETEELFNEEECEDAEQHVREILAAQDEE